MRVVRRVQLLDLPLGIVGEHHLHRIEHRHHTRHAHVEVVANEVLEQRQLGTHGFPRHAHGLPERVNRLGRHAAPAQTGERRHARIIPPAYELLVHEPQELALAHHRVLDLTAGELHLRGRMLIPGLAHEPVVDLAAVLELQRAQRARDALDGVRQSMGEVVQRIDAPRVATPVMVGMANAQ